MDDKSFFPASRGVNTAVFGPQPRGLLNPTTIAVGYLVIAGLWIMLSDLAASLLVKAPEQAALVQSFKGLGFVAITAVGLWIILHSWSRQSSVQLEALRRSESRFRMMSDAAPVMVWIAGPDKRCTFFNARWLEFRGTTLDEELGDGWTRGIHPDDCTGAIACYDSAFERGVPFEMEYRLLRHDGEYRWLLDRGVPIRSDAGDLRGYIGCCTDITERKLWESRIEFVLSELDHRVKNNLAAVLSLAQQTILQSQSLTQFQEVFLGRVEAMARAHSMLAARQWQGLGLRDAAESILDQHNSSKRRIFFQGDDLLLPATTAQTMALILHELGTNAVKYGSLSVPQGIVHLRWDRRLEESGPVVSIEWVEEGGPPAQAPTRRGFGLKFIESAVRHELRGHAVLRFEPTGLRCTLTCPELSVDQLPPLGSTARSEDGMNA